VIRSGVSIIICCYNSALRLPETLKYLSNQKVPDNLLWELIIVNNSSTDNTEETAYREWKKYNTNANFRLINEPVPGLSAAREAGIKATSYEYILFCDDDNWLEESYLATAFEIINSNKRIGILGGLGNPCCETKAPEWFEGLKAVYAVGKLANSDGDVTQIRGYVFGAGMVIRRSVYDELRNNGFKSLLSDRKGQNLTAGGDVELCYAVKMSGYQIWYSEKLKFIHFIPAGRLTSQYLFKLFEGIGNAQIVLSVYTDVINGKRYPGKRLWVNKLMEQSECLMKEFILYILKRKLWHKLQVRYYYGFIKALIKCRSDYYFNYLTILNLKDKLQNKSLINNAKRD
jgi:glycosyltransferase involved in cell wall biosynthesis